MQKNFINLVRGLAIFLMLWGHCIQICIPNGLDFFENFAFKVIYSFHMPLFMLISGYLFYYSFEKRNMNELLTHRCKGLLHVIIFCGIFIYFMTTGLYSFLQGEIGALFYGKWLSSLSNLWFVWSVLSSSIVVGVICKKVNKLWKQIVLLFIGGIVVVLFPNGINNLFMYPYYIIGFYFAKYRKNIPEKLMHVKYFSIVIFPVMLIFFEKKHYIYTTGLFGGGYTIMQSVGIDLFRWAIGLVGSGFILVLMEVLYNFAVNKKPQFCLWNGIEYLGKKSLQIYALSIIFLSSYLTIVYPYIVGWIPQINTFFINHIWIYNLGFTLLLGIAYSFGISLIIKMFEKLKINQILFGR